ncbi:hypothetical protein [Candidatus Venteria ishoeyi]|uniref:Uncharacterized protein n=1 Tax=Candidatus Venteria ishoeyi TaxID=1899563 RepID=A0A1H6F7L5_9GAMM|nr:hypothetical protein [Candidatus Venteria ishoeyi]SEH06127.1 Uncharacterised protein [Candidatus Venteria ishoeyi]
MLKNLDVQITPLYTGHVQIDADASPFNNSGTKKEHVSWTYKNFDGYNPMFVYLGQEDWSIAAELHPGSCKIGIQTGIHGLCSVHSNNNNQAQHTNNHAFLLI